MASAAVQQGPGHTTPFVPLPLTSEAPAARKHDVQTALSYYKDPGDGSEPAPAYVGQPETSERPSIDVAVTVRDIRGEEDKYNLDEHGFQLHAHVSAEKDFASDADIVSKYYPETEQLLKDAIGASRVFIFDHIVRRGRPAPNDDSGGRIKKLRGPVNRVHIDQSFDAAQSRVPYHLPDEADRLLRTRTQIINVWRPVRTVRRDPLATADASSVPRSDLVAAALISPDRRGETFVVLPNPNHRWHYASYQTPDEVMFIKCFDSKLDGRVRGAPHSAFVDPNATHEEDRESIEIRALVFHEDQPAE